ncbi:MAG: hypothetical protein ACKV2Q_05745 [Planctomycetaceae bacterium]
MLRLRSPHLMSQRLSPGNTKPLWVRRAWLLVAGIGLPLWLVVLAVQSEWFAKPNVLYSIHDGIYLPLRGWLVLEPWPGCLIVHLFWLSWLGGVALSLLIGRSPLKTAYVWMTAVALFALSRLDLSLTTRLLNWWSGRMRSRHDFWPLVADRIRARMLRRFDVQPTRRAARLADVMEWTNLTIHLRRLVPGVSEDASADDEVSLTRQDRLKNAVAWTDAALRLCVVVSDPAAVAEAGQPALLTGDWSDVVRRGDASVWQRLTLAWRLLCRRPSFRQMCLQLAESSQFAVPETIHQQRGRDAGYSASETIGFDFASLATDLVQFAESMRFIEGVGPEVRRACRGLLVSAENRRRTVEQTLNELELFVFHPSFASGSSIDRRPLEQDVELGRVSLNLALVPAVLTGEAGTVAGLLDAIDALHFAANAADGNAHRAGLGSEPSHRLLSTLSEVPAADQRLYCRELQIRACGTVATEFASSDLEDSPLVTPGDLCLADWQAEMVDRVSRLR